MLELEVYPEQSLSSEKWEFVLGELLVQRELLFAFIVYLNYSCKDCDTLCQSWDILWCFSIAFL